MTTEQVADRYGVASITVKKWAKEDGRVKKKIMPGYSIMAYDFTEADCKRFEKRPSPGWKKGVPRKKKTKSQPN